MTPTFLGAGEQHMGSSFEACVLDDELRLQYFESEIPAARSSFKCMRELNAE